MATLPVTLLNGTTADANDVMDDFDEIYSNIDESNIGAANKTGSGKIVLQTSPTLAGTVVGTYTLAGTPTITAPTISAPAITGAIDMSAGAVTVDVANTTNALNIDSNTLVIDGTNHRVGINTNAPAKKFQIKSSVADEEVIRIVGFTTGTSLLRLKFFNSDLTRAFEVDADFTSGSESFIIQSDTTTCATISRNGQLLMANVDPPTSNYANRNSFVKGWARVKSDGTLLASYNVSSSSKGATGNYTVNWNTDFSSANYAVVATVDESTSSAFSITSRSLAAGSTAFKTWNSSGVTVDTDFQVIAIGTQ